MSAASGLVGSLRHLKSGGRGWAALHALIVLGCWETWSSHRDLPLFLTFATWVVFGLIPGFIARVYNQQMVRQHYSAARRLARWIAWLHPADGWRQQASIIHALELAHEGDTTTALAMLEKLRTSDSPIGWLAKVHLYRITNQWEEVLKWHQADSRRLNQMQTLIPVMLRAHGECGDVVGMAALYRIQRGAIEKMIPPASRDLCRLMLFAFCGRRHLVEYLFSHSLAPMPEAIKSYWIATAESAAGNSESARSRFDALLASADPPTRLSVERRLSHLADPPVLLDEPTEQLILEVARDHSHDESFGARRSLFSAKARATQLVIALNIAMYGAELALGGGTNADALMRLGAMYPPAVYGGEWWRLLAAQFLHFGLLHLAMNMATLWLLGPFVEFALGTRRFLVTYLTAGTASMLIVLCLAGRNSEQVLVGASGCIMGLVGAMGALMLRGWRQERAATARRRLIAILLIIVMQTVFDSVVPEVSMTAHLSGTVTGFLVALIFRHRLQPVTPEPPDAETVEQESVDP